MKRMSSWEDLREYGIYSLTGEACVVGMRLLCDLTAEGVKRIRKFFGLPDADYLMSEAIRRNLDPATAEAQAIRLRVRQFDSSMNNGDPANPHVASMMLFRDSFQDLAVMCLLDGGAQLACIMENGEVYGIYGDDLPDLAGEVEVDDYEHPGQKIRTMDPIGKLAQWGHVVRRVGRLTSQPARGLNAVHEFSGRSAGSGD